VTEQGVHCGAHFRVRTKGPVDEVTDEATDFRRTSINDIAALLHQDHFSVKQNLDPLELAYYTVQKIRTYHKQKKQSTPFHVHG